MKFEHLPRGRPSMGPEEGHAPRAMWMAPEVIESNPFWQYASNKFFLGRMGNSLIGLDDNRHILTIAGNRAGKGVSSILMQLLLSTSSICCVDPKGENATIAAARRGQGEGVPAGGLGQDVFVLDPFVVANVPAHYRAGFNPIATLDPSSLTFVDDCDNIADALVVPVPGGEAEHWDNSARLFLRALVAWVAASLSIKKRDLNTVRKLAFLPPVAAEGSEGGDFFGLLDEMSRSEIAAGVCAEGANALAGMGEDERGSVLSTVRKNLGFLSSPAMAEMLSGSMRAPNLLDWKMGGQSVFLCLPANRMHRHAQFLRLFLNCLLSAVETNQEKSKVPGLIIVDEAATIGFLNSLQIAAGLIAGFGCRIQTIWQDIGQIKSIYKDRWETFLGNASVFETFGLNDKSSLEYVSERLGKSSIMSISHSELSTEKVAQGFTGRSKSIQEAPLLTPDEVAYFFSRQSNNKLILYPGCDPIMLERVAYYEPAFRDYASR